MPYHILFILSYVPFHINFQNCVGVAVTPARMEQHALITMVVVDMSVSVLLALREPTVKMVHNYICIYQALPISLQAEFYYEDIMLLSYDIDVYI